MRFSKSEIDEITRAIASRGVKDTDFPEATNVSGNDYVAVVQNGVNKKIKVNHLVRNSDSAVTLPLLPSGGVYNHGLGKKPSVTVMGVFPEGLKEIICDIEYVDNDSVKVNFSLWDNWDGYVYIK